MGCICFIVLFGVQRLQPLASRRPIISQRSAADAPGWAHCIFSSCCHWLHMGLLFLREMLLMSPDGFIALVAAVGFVWAHYISERYRQPPLPHGPTAFASAAADGFTCIDIGNKRIHNFYLLEDHNYAGGANGNI